jgi:hypothetical protein
MVTRNKSAVFRPQVCHAVFCAGPRYPSHYRPAFAFCPILYPLTHRRPLRFACPGVLGRVVGLTSFRCCNTTGLGSVFPPCALSVRAIQAGSEWSRACRFGLSRKLLRLITDYDVYQQFTYVNHTNQPSPLPVEATSTLRHLAMLPGPFARNSVHCSLSFAPHRYQ